MRETDTICAVATSMSESAINIIRISGEDSINIVNGIFLGANLLNKDGFTLTYGRIINKSKEIIDEVLVSVFRAPKSYTRENMVEINTHGGSFVTTQVLIGIFLTFI